MKMYKFYVLTSDNDRGMKQVRKKKRGMNEGGERERESRKCYISVVIIRQMWKKLKEQ